MVKNKYNCKPIVWETMNEIQQVKYNKCLDRILRNQFYFTEPGTPYISPIQWGILCHNIAFNYAVFDFEPVTIGYENSNESIEL